MSADGSRVAVGASHHVRIFDWNGSRWKQVGSWNRTLVSVYFGCFVALSADGNRVAMVVFEEPCDGAGAGHVLLYDWNGTHWTQVGSTLAGEKGCTSGWRLALSADGNRLAVGAYSGMKGSGEYTGLAYIYHLTGTRWTQMGSTLEGDAAADSFGFSVALSADGNRLAVSTAPSGVHCDAAYVRIYDWTGSQWMQVGSDLDHAARIRLYHSIVALSEDGTRVVVGGRGRRFKWYEQENDDETGHVRIYDWTGSQWIQVGSDLEGVSLGWSIALSADGNRLACGAPFKESYDGFPLSTFPGVVHMYDWTGNEWRQQVGSALEGKLEGEYFGCSVALSANGSRVAIGANDFGNLFMDGVVSAGKMRIYDLFPSVDD
jgi:hypothetical protein